MKRLEIGPYNTPKFIGEDVTYLDKMNVLPNTVVWDLERMPLPFPDNNFDEVMASHILEHVTPSSTIPLLNEIHRTTKPGGTFHVRVPHFRYEIYDKTLDHKQFFNSRTIRDLTPANGYADYGLKMWNLIELHEVSRFTWILHNTVRDVGRLKGRWKWLRPLYYLVHDWNHLWIPAEIQARLTPIKEPAK